MTVAQESQRILRELTEISAQYFNFNPPTFPSSENQDLQSTLFQNQSIVSGFGMGKDDKGAFYVRVYTSKKVKMNIENPLIAGCRAQYVFLGKDLLFNNPIPHPSPKYYTENGKFTCGSSIGAIDDFTNKPFAGTLGAIVKIGSQHFGLSNNHVFAGFNFYPKNKPFNMPAPMDTTPTQTARTETIGRLANIFPLAFGGPDFVTTNTMDAALIKIDDIAKVSSKQGTFFDSPIRTKDPTQGMKVKKVGRTSGQTFGTVEAVTPLKRLNTDEKRIPYFLCGPMWEVAPQEKGAVFSEGGDSGSLIVTEDEQFAVGLLVAGSKAGTTFIIPIQPILSHFGAQIVNGL